MSNVEHASNILPDQVGRTTLQTALGAAIMTGIELSVMLSVVVRNAGVITANTKFFRPDSRTESNTLVHTGNLASLVLMRWLCCIIIV